MEVVASRTKESTPIFNLGFTELQKSFSAYLIQQLLTCGALDAFLLNFTPASHYSLVKMRWNR
jgi:hypothetical protein